MKWVYKVVTVDPGGQRVTYEYDKEAVASASSHDDFFVVRMHDGAVYAFNRRYILTWRLQEVPE